MKLVKMLAVAAVTMGVLQGCEPEERTTQSGLKYTVIEDGEGKLPEEGEFMIMNMSYGVGDSVWMDTKDRYPVILPKEDSAWRTGGKIHEIFADLKVGDSVTFNVSAETLFAKTWQQQVPPDLTPETMISFHLGVDSTMTSQEYGNWQQKMMDEERIKQEEMMAEQLDIDVSLIEQYLQENNIQAQKTESGLHYVIHEQGSGAEANPLDTVSVNYTGYLLNGDIFDSSDENIARENNIFVEGRPYGPIDFVLGRDRIIRGWHEGIDLLNEGGRATLYVPSNLGYGPNASGKIPANAVLAFDVELVDIN
jgi:FKBP-type peptidyl-prolyl cis-trans isomerase FkpA